MRLFALALVAAFGAGCSHAVIIDSEPTGAEIKVNGEKLGKAPVTYTETTGWDKVYDIEASQPGYKPTRKEVKQTDWNVPVSVMSGGGYLLWSLGTLGAGFFLPFPLVGLLWAKQMPDRVVIDMERGGPGPADVGSNPTPPSSYGY